MLFRSKEMKTKEAGADTAAAAAAKTPFFMSKPQPTTPVQLVLDEKYQTAKPVNYRKNEELRMSGSSMYSIRALKEIAKPAKKLKAPLYVFDLRQESHGYVNDKPATWQADHDWANSDLNHDEAIQRERRQLSELAIGSTVDGITVNSTESEESVVRSQGHEYVRLTVTDHLRPTDTEVDRFLSAVRGLPEKSWVHFQCRAGKGRTTTFMVMYDMLHNASNASFDEIIKRNAELSDDYDVMAVVPNDNWKYVYQKERADFVREFYNYAKANPDAKGQLWTEWVRKRSEEHTSELQSH